jgi:hypothetical protein
MDDNFEALVVWLGHRNRHDHHCKLPASCGASQAQTVSVQNQIILCGGAGERWGLRLIDC